MNASRRSLAVLTLGICSVAMSAAQASLPTKHAALERVAAHRAPTPAYKLPTPTPSPTCGPPFVSVVPGWLGHLMPDIHICPV